MSSSNINQETDPSLTYTLEDFVDVGESTTTLSYYAMSIIDGTSVYYSIQNVIDDYLAELRELAEDVTLNDEQYNKYSYAGVDILSYMYYGTTEYWYLILLLNGVYKKSDFNMHTIKLVEKTVLINFLNSVYNAEKEYIQYNRSSKGI